MSGLDDKEWWLLILESGFGIQSALGSRIEGRKKKTCPKGQATHFLRSDDTVVIAIVAKKPVVK